ncbi:MAG: YfiR family protein [Bacteroidota bacterium]|nr:YfiR family protein [Bacteroidota bacterium]MDP4205215.1 YfiR family protein [Bacteroidota bacterium]
MISLFFLFSFSSKVLAQKENEYQIKGLFVERFTKFISWNDSLSSVGHPFKITVLGNNPFGNRLDIIYHNKFIQNRRVEINYIGNIKQIQSPDILFICNSEKDQISRIIQKVSGKPVLTIADSPGFAQKGVIINFFFTSDNRIHFEINPKHAILNQLKISRLLLNNAKLVL